MAYGQFNEAPKADYVGSTPSTQTALQSRPLANALDELERSIGRLYEDIMFLSGRLEPIRTPQPVNEKTGRITPDRNMTGSLTAYVVEQTQRLDQMHQYVAGLTQELDI